MEIPETKSFIPKGFELGTTLSLPNNNNNFIYLALKSNNCPIGLLYSSMPIKEFVLHIKK